jgi:hypothetical protein
MNKLKTFGNTGSPAEAKRLIEFKGVHYMILTIKNKSIKRL